jgi:hypothetical protein
MKMNTKRTIAITLTLLMTASAVGTLSVSAVVVAPTKSTSLTIYSTDLSPSVGESITIFGRLMNGAGTGYIQGASVQGQPITLTYSTDNGQTWNSLGTAAMSYYGGYSYTTTSSQLPLLTSQTEQDYYINASFAGTALYAPSSVTMLIQVYPISPGSSVQTSVAAPVAYQPFTISGKMTDDYTGKACPWMWVYAYAGEQYTSNYQYLGGTQTNANGLYKFPAIQLPVGNWQIDVWTEGDFNHNYGENWIYVSINTAPTQLSIASGTAHPAVNTPFTVYGLLTNQQTGARLANEQGLTLTYSSDGGSTWNTLPGSVSTNANGQYAFSLTLPANGYYQIQVHFPGDSPNYYPSDSQPTDWTIRVGSGT